MFTVDASETYQASSDVIFIHVCGPCQDDGDLKKAKHYCEVCCVKLCTECRNDHAKFKGTKNHNIVTLEMSAVESNGSFKIRCSCDHRQAVEIYCENHTDVFCSTCTTVKHRNCNTGPIFLKVSENTKNNINAAIEKVKSLENKIEKYKLDRERDSKKLEDLKSECKREVEKFRQEICEAAGKMAENTLKSIDELADLQRLSIEKHISTSKAALSVLVLDKDLLEKAKASGKDTLMFAAESRTSKCLNEYENLIHDLDKTMLIPRLIFEKNKFLEDSLKNSESLGKVEICEMPVDKKNKVILDMKVQSSKKVNIKLPGDESIPNITGCTILSNGNVLLSDYNNRNLKMLDANWFVIKSLTLSHKPWDIMAVNDNYVLVNLHGTKSQYIHILPEMELGKTILLENGSPGIGLLNEEIYTVRCGEKREILILDLSGNLKRKISLGQECASRPDYLCLSTQSIGLHVYLTDWKNNKLLGLKLDDSRVVPVLQYADKELKRPNGLYVDSLGNVLVCGTNSNNVVIVTADGKKYGDLLTEREIKKPKSIAFRPADDTLIVGCEDNTNLFVFKLGK